MDFMQEYFPQVKITQLQATYLLWLDFRAFNLTNEELEMRNRQKRAFILMKVIFLVKQVVGLSVGIWLVQQNIFIGH